MSQPTSVLCPTQQAILRDRHQDVLYSDDFNATALFDPKNRTLDAWLPVSRGFQDAVGVVAAGVVRVGHADFPAIKRL